MHTVQGNSYLSGNLNFDLFQFQDLIIVLTQSEHVTMHFIQ